MSTPKRIYRVEPGERDERSRRWLPNERNRHYVRKSDALYRLKECRDGGYPDARLLMSELRWGDITAELYPRGPEGSES